MKYYSFDKQEYYALIGAKNAEQAIRIYVDNVAGENVEGVLAEGSPTLMKKYDAFVKFAEGVREEEQSIGELIKDFEEGGLLLIDGSLA